MTIERKKDRPEYSVWNGIKTRCSNVNHVTYRDYGGKGISVCQQWNDSFDIFLADMGPRPEGYSIDRIDSRGNYEPGNCRWATRQEQNNNRRTNRLVEFRGDKMSLGDARKLSGSNISSGHILGRLARGWILERALSEPVLQGGELNRARREVLAKGNELRWARVRAEI